jgi:hypothetical protein
MRWGWRRSPASWIQEMNSIARVTSTASAADSEYATTT